MNRVIIHCKHQRPYTRACNETMQSLIDGRRTVHLAGVLSSCLCVPSVRPSFHLSDMCQHASNWRRSLPCEQFRTNASACNNFAHFDERTNRTERERMFYFLRSLNRYEEVSLKNIFVTFPLGTSVTADAFWTVLVHAFVVLYNLVAWVCLPLKTSITLYISQSNASPSTRRLYTTPAMMPIASPAADRVSLPNDNGQDTRLQFVRVFRRVVHLGSLRLLLCCYVRTRFAVCRHHTVAFYVDRMRVRVLFSVGLSDRALRRFVNDLSIWVLLNDDMWLLSNCACV